jgi:hypothetical protein
MFRLMAASLFVAGTLAYAQYGASPEYNPRWVNGVIDHVHEDLNHAYGVWRFSGGDRHRLNHAEQELREFANKWDRGRFDKGELDDAIGSIQHVVDHNRMPPQDREALYNDTNQLRSLREAFDHGRVR